MIVLFEPGGTSQCTAAASTLIQASGSASVVMLVMSRVQLWYNPPLCVYGNEQFDLAATTRQWKTIFYCYTTTVMSLPMPEHCS